MTDETIGTAVQKGLDFLSERQLSTGGFSTLTAQAVNGTNEEMEVFDYGDKKGTVEVDLHSVFPAILIGLALLPAAGVGNTGDLLQKIARFLVDNGNRFGIWQHFTKEHPLHEVTPSDEDLSAMASAFLRQMGIPIPDNHKALLDNKRPDGLIYTWFTFRKDLNFNPAYWYCCLRELKNPVKSHFFWKYLECERDDIDAVVNANVLSYVGLNEKIAPIVRWMNEVIAGGTEHCCDKWYLKKSTVYYFFSRNYHLGIEGLEPMRRTIRERVLASFLDNGSVENHPLDTALMINTLLNLNYRQDIPAAAIAFLLGQQKQKGNWARRILYYGGPKRIMGWGSEELTTAYCVEALFRYSAVPVENELMPENIFIQYDTDQAD